MRLNAAPCVDYISFTGALEPGMCDDGTMKCNRAAVIPKRATERLIPILVTTLGYRISGIGCHRIQRFSHDKNQAGTGMHWDVRPLLVLTIHPEG